MLSFCVVLWCDVARCCVTRCDGAVMVPTGVWGFFGSVLFQHNGTNRRFECFFGTVIFQRDGATPSVVISLAEFLTAHSLCPAIQLLQCHLLLHCRRLPHLPLLLACPDQKLRGRSLGVFREKEKKTCVNVCECTYSPTSIGSLFLFSFCFQLFPDSDFIYQ